VAGLFYPKSGAALGELLGKLLAEASDEGIGRVRAIVCPHAGYEYSGPTAAAAYRQITGVKGATVVLLAPSHYADFRGGAVSTAVSWRTPLGDARISTRAAELAKVSPFFASKPVPVQRPPWARAASREAPPAGQDTAETWEHSAEVQVPFLQKALGEFEMIPVVCGAMNAEAAAKALAPLLDDHTIVVASSDLSHYHAYDDAKARDSRCVKAVTDLDTASMAEQEACGKTPILVVLNLAKIKGWRTRLLDYRNSGDTAGDKSRVVGYAAIAFTDAPAADGPTRQPLGGADTGTTAVSAQEAAGGDVPQFTAEERGQLLKLARDALTGVVAKGALPPLESTAVPAKFRETKGCFVTLTKHGQLRGCIGHIVPREPLWQAVRDNARSAALDDPRFEPVRGEELKDIEVEVSVLTVPKPLAFSSPQDLVSKIHAGRDGIVLDIGGRMATYLPQVWEQIPEEAAFLAHLSEKAGRAGDAWKGPNVKVSTYRVEAFKEEGQWR
jgi:hypothetical protein